MLIQHDEYLKSDINISQTSSPISVPLVEKIANEAHDTEPTIVSEQTQNPNSWFYHYS